MTQKGLERLLATITAAKRRNKDLSTRLAQVEKSRREWREKALERQRTITNLRTKIRRMKKPRQRPWSPEIRFTSLELERIRAIPIRDILPP